MSEIERLTARVADLSSKVDFWNNGVLIFLVMTALAAAGIVICPRLAFVRAGQTASAQNDLDAAKEHDAKAERDRVRTELAGAETKVKEADARIVEAQRGVAEANEKAERERLARVETQILVSARHIPAENISKLSDALREFKGRSVVLASYANDPESYGLKGSILSALTAVPISVQDLSGRQVAVGQAATGVTVFGPPSESTFVDALAKSISAAGRLQMISESERPAGSPVTITVGIKPPFFFNIQNKILFVLQFLHAESRADSGFVCIFSIVLATTAGAISTCEERSQ